MQWLGGVVHLDLDSVRYRVFDETEKRYPSDKTIERMMINDMLNVQINFQCHRMMTKQTRIVDYS